MKEGEAERYMNDRGRFQKEGAHKKVSSYLCGSAMAVSEKYCIRRSRKALSNDGNQRFVQASC